MKSFLRKIFEIGIPYVMKIILKLLDFYEFRDPKEFNKKLEYFFTFHLRPKLSSKIYLEDKFEINNSRNNNIAVLIQGPLVLEDNFTLETIKILLKTYSRSQIILSTWKDEDSNELEKIRNTGITILENVKPKNTGLFNINYQLVSTKAGIVKAKEHGYEWVLKTRTDCRIYESNVGVFLLNLLDQFPVVGRGQNSRVIGIDINTSKSVLFDLSDIFQFGHVSDIEKLWDFALDFRNIGFHNFDHNLKISDLYSDRIPEVMVMKNFLNKTGFPTSNSYENYYKALVDRFIIIDSKSIDFYWYKYKNNEFYDSLHYEENKKKSKMTFKDWFILYSSKDNFTVSNKYYDERFL